MSWVELHREQAFNEGSNLWIIGDLGSSQWSHKINWYLNFQLRRAKFHESRTISPELSAVLNTWEVEPPQFKVSSTAPLLIESSKLLPNQVTVQLFNRNFDAWVEEAFQIWTDLQKPSVRVFIPAGKPLSQLTSRWIPAEGVSATYLQE